MPRKIVIARDFTCPTQDSSLRAIANVGELRSAGVARFLREHVLRYDEASVLVNTIDPAHLSLKTCVALRMLSRGAAWFEDPSGQRQPVTWPMMARIARRWLRDAWLAPGQLKHIDRELAKLEQTVGARSRTLQLDRSPVYLRTDLVFGVRAGGSVGHIAGVLNNLSHFTGKPICLTSDRIPTVDPKIPTTVISAEPVFLNNSELAAMRYNREFLRRASDVLGETRPAFIYQRACGNNYAGLSLARRFGVPFVLEYNGSESWVSRNWGERRRYEAITDRVENLNLRAADLVVVVSKALRDELLERGVDAERILVNPNGVDPEMYSPEVDGSQVRARRGLEGKFVFGFIGTFGRWHGAEVLVDALGKLLADRPELREKCRLLLIGDGGQMPAVVERIESLGLREQVVLTGLVPQQEGPAHLAACDVLVSPHVPNPDGSPFFGSPTKLFEYMAMGRGIVASQLDQLAEVLAHDETAWLVKPGNAASLAAGMAALHDDPARRDRLGAAARREALNHHTWRKHTERIVDRLIALCGRRAALAA